MVDEDNKKVITLYESFKGASQESGVIPTWHFKKFFTCVLMFISCVCICVWLYAFCSKLMSCG